jgi:hypothetical protein
MNRHTGSPNKSPSQPQPAQPPRNPGHSAKDQRSQHTSAREDSENAESEQVEGEGSYTATHRYNEGLREHLQTHDVEAEAEAAREALEGDERTELEQAEQRGKSRAAEQERSSKRKPTQH